MRTETTALSAPPGHQIPMPKATATSKRAHSTIPVVPCAHISVTAPASFPIPCRRACLHFLAACAWFWVTYLLWVATRSSGFAALHSATVRPLSRHLLSHQCPLDFYHLSSHGNGSAPPFVHRTATPLVLSETPPLPVAPVPAPLPVCAALLREGEHDHWQLSASTTMLHASSSLHTQRTQSASRR
jgi:hypothetical protein